MIYLTLFIAIVALACALASLVIAIRERQKKEVATVQNIEARFGLWTESFLSALGLNSGGGGGGWWCAYSRQSEYRLRFHHLEDIF